MAGGGGGHVLLASVSKNGTEKMVHILEFGGGKLFQAWCQEGRGVCKSPLLTHPDWCLTSGPISTQVNGPKRKDSFGSDAFSMFFKRNSLKLNV